jgi:hypothetical protein
MDLGVNTHSGKDLVQFIETYPRDELIQADHHELLEVATGVLQMQERDMTRLFMRKDAFGRFVSAMVYVPRERYNTQLRKDTQKILQGFLGSEEPVEFTTYFSESVLARTHYFVRINDSTVEFNVKEIEQKAEQNYVEGIWYVTEVERYSGLSPFISFFFSSGNVKKMIEEVLKNDSAFLFTKNDGRLTIRRFGLAYEYHKIPSWMTTQNPSKEFSDSRTFMSSVAVQYNRNFKSDKSESIFLYDEKETEIFEIYTKRNK